MLLPGTCSEECRVQSFSLGTLLGNKDVLRTVERDTHLAVQPLPAKTGKDGGQLVAVRSADIGTFLAEALAPDLHIGHVGALHRPLLLQTAEVGAGEEVAAFKEVHLRPAFRQKGVHIFPHQPLALIGLHGFPLLILGQRVHFGREVELLTLPHIHESFRPDLEDLLVGQVPGLLLPAAGGLDRPDFSRL